MSNDRQWCSHCKRFKDKGAFTEGKLICKSCVQAYKDALEAMRKARREV